MDTDRDYVPGDIIELSVVATCRSYIELELKAPVHPHARLLEIQPFPIAQNEGGLFQSEWVVVYQIGRSGSVALEGGSVALKPDPESPAHVLPQISFTVGSIGQDPAGDSPESWVDETPSESVIDIIGVIVVIALGVALYLVFQRYIKRGLKGTTDMPGTSAQVSAVRLCKNLEQENCDPRELERFLQEYHSKCSDRLIALFETRLYSRNPGNEELMRSLKKEFAE